MIREQAKSKIRMSVTVNKDYIKSLEKADEVIDQIYDDHEKTTSELRAEVIHQTDKVERLKEQIKAKDELIKDLECRAYHAEGYINDLHNNSKEQQ